MAERRADQPSARRPTREALLRLVLAQGQEHALLLLDAEGRFVGWEMGAEGLFGYSRAEAVGRPVDILFTPEDRLLGMPGHELRTARERGSAEDDRWHLRRDGGRVWTSGVVTPLRDEAGTLVGYAKVVRDRTDVKAQVEALEQRVETLGQSDRRKSLVIGTLAHELDNTFLPLGTALHLVREQVSADEGLAHLLELGEKQLAVTRRLIADLKDVTRIAAGKLELRRRRVLLNDVVEQAAATCRPLADERRQALELILPPALVVVDADPERMHQVFVNLVTNACKYTPAGGSVSVSLTTEGEDVSVRVQDTGAGIAPELLPRLFTLFTQDESTLGQSRGGLGIGLWLVKSIVDLHGGNVAVRSDGVGRGSEFSVRMPYTSAVPLDEE